MVKGVDEKQQVDSQILTLYTVDLDQDPKLSFQRISGFYRSDSSLPSMEKPFEVKTSASEGTVVIKFSPQEDMKGYFTFNVSVSDGKILLSVLRIKTLIFSLAGFKKLLAFSMKNE